MTELTPFIDKLLWPGVGFLAGSLLSLATAYVIVVKDIAYIKGQLQNLLKLGDTLADTNRSIVILDRNQVGLKKDLDAAHAAIRELKKVSNQ